MTHLACAIVRNRLSPFTDQELPIDEQIAIESHLYTCAACAAQADELRLVGHALRDRTSGAHGDSARDLAGLAANVVSRLRAERDQSVVNRVGRLFDDWHLVWAGAGATAATFLCAAAINAMLLFTAQMRPDSLAAILAGLASVGSNANPAWLAQSMLAPRADVDTVMPAAVVNHGRSEDVMFALAAVVTREGTLSNLELVGQDGRFSRSVRGTRQDLLDVLDAAATARFEPARYGGSPVAVNMIWLLAQTTVRGKARVDDGWQSGAAVPAIRPAVKESPVGAGPAGATKPARRSSIGVVGV